MAWPGRTIASSLPLEVKILQYNYGIHLVEVPSTPILTTTAQWYL